MNSIAKDEVKLQNNQRTQQPLNDWLYVKRCSNSLDECDLRDPVREPADDVDGDDGQHELRHLAVGLPLAL